MQKYLLKIDKIKKKFPVAQNENFKPAQNGTHHKVFISNNYVIRFRDENPDLLQRESKLLKELKHPLIPRILWSGKINKSFVMIENRLPGIALNSAWRNIKNNYKTRIIQQAVNFIKYLKTEKRNYFYSVNTGKKYNFYFNYLTDGIDVKIAKIKKFKQANKIIEDLLAIIKQRNAKNIFKKSSINIVHGDLIVHNILTDGKNLTGVIDWELALFGDPNHDLFRLFYYQECAKAYQEQGNDETFEADYMDKLIAEILKSNIIKNKKLFQKKYQFVRATFFLNALYWAVNSSAPKKIINELIMRWDKKSPTSSPGLWIWRRSPRRS